MGCENLAASPPFHACLCSRAYHSTRQTDSHIGLTCTLPSRLQDALFHRCRSRATSIIGTATCLFASCMRSMELPSEPYRPVCHSDQHKTFRSRKVLEGHLRRARRIRRHMTGQSRVSVGWRSWWQYHTVDPFEIRSESQSHKNLRKRYHLDGT